MGYGVLVMLVGMGLFLWSTSTKSKAVAAVGLLFLVGGAALAMVSILAVVNEV